MNILVLAIDVVKKDIELMSVCKRLVIGELLWRMRLETQSSNLSKERVF